MLVIPVSRYYKVVYKNDLLPKDSPKTQFVQRSEPELGEHRETPYKRPFGLSV